MKQNRCYFSFEFTNGFDQEIIGEVQGKIFEIKRFV